MFLTKRHIPRRTFLRGAGVTLALPLLDAMVAAQTPLGKTPASPVKRFVGIWHPHGAAPGYWSPTQEGKDFEFSYITKPLEPYRDRVTLISNLDAVEAFATTEEPGGDHARGAMIFSGVRPRRNSVSPYLGVWPPVPNPGPSTIDQVIADKLGQDTLLSSIQLGVEDTGNFGNCNWGYSCAYSNCMSWTSPTTPLPTEVNPRVAFERLFGDGGSAEERLQGRKENSSILDSVTQEAALLKKDLGPGDQCRLDDYLQNVREIERRINIAMSHKVVEPSQEIPFGIPTSRLVHYRLMYDLMHLAFQADLTRSATFMLGRDLTGTSFPESGFDGGWHGSSHHGDKPDNIANYAKINRYHVNNLAYFCEKLKNTPEGDGNLLDHILIYKGTNMGNSHRHAHVKVPVELVGGVDGTFKGNRHLVYQENTQATHNLLLSILHLYGINVEKFGNSTGPLPGFAV